jgi:hypothetical protein
MTVLLQLGSPIDIMCGQPEGSAPPGQPQKMTLLLCRRSYKELLDGSSWHLLAHLPGLSSNTAGSHVGKAYHMSS